ncbi:IS66 family insertion sequence element accessory protein TnpB [Membranicola marinus]|uniref:IS66 family insertion sequence element accessory protein TnpB n=1 Tax=Membranihabitans marinus TaxID=1227546 RepID=A0A953HQI8_9BACT|nr:IS66 family insertion sequence element accessory protein TnpB [Membranihabitans marinus]MBY5959404.1 IS66 family insertion sequence element accessory protein TnpB [Membranihabitans marinus]
MFESTRRYYLYNRPVDMRKSFNTLCGVVRHQMDLELEENVGYIFINKRTTHMKVLFWEGDGLSIYFKRLEQGTFEHPDQGPDYRISYEKLMLILQGISTQKIVRRKRYKLV